MRVPGSGIFSSPGVLLSSTGSPGAALVVWLASGLLAWSGASSFIELGCAVPVNGGSQAYLNCASPARPTSTSVARDALPGQDDGSE